MVSEHMSGFLDFRYKEAKLNMIASEIRVSLKIGRCFTPGNYELKKCAQHKSTGTVSVTGETFNFETKSCNSSKSVSKTIYFLKILLNIS